MNKADLAHADMTVQQLKGSVALGSTDKRRVKVLKTIATTSQGVDALADAALKLAGEKMKSTAPTINSKRARSLLAARVSDMIAKRLRSAESTRLDELADKLASGDIDLERASNAAIRLMGSTDDKDGMS